MGSDGSSGARGRDAGGVARGLGCAGRVSGVLRTPSSKSLAQRALVMAGLAAGTTRIAGLPDGDDVRVARALVERAGADVRELAPAAVAITGRPPGPHRGWTAPREIDLGESGTLTRLALAAFGLCGRAGERVRLVGRGTLTKRSSAPLVEALSQAGVRFQRREWPLELTPIGPPPTVRLCGAVSSQEASALALALAAWPDELELTVEGALPSRPYFEMTLALLARFGVSLVRTSFADGESVLLRGPLRAPEQPLAIEADASLAAVALAAACLSGGSVEVSGVGRSSVQGDVRIGEQLRAFGCWALAFDDRLCASGFPQRAASVDLSDAPDLAPVLAIVAAGAAMLSGNGASVLSGLDTLPRKESSRIEVLAEGLQRAGWSASASARELVVGAPRAGTAGEVVLDPHGDHRMAFAFALLGLLRPGVLVSAPQCVAKSWPSFWDDMRALGASVEERG
jgi:3-phosphoshikimate 1-carboxyvinyltransferase